MNWLGTLIITVLGGLAGLLLAGLVANACVSWYRIPAFEGQSGYFVVYAALAGGVAGLILSLVTALIVAAYFGPGFARGLASAVCVLLIIASAAAVICRLRAHVPPKIDGRELNLEVEFRFPVGHATTAPPTSEGEWSVQLDPVLSRSSHQDTVTGEIDNGKARLENGRWIVPTKVHLFTERGKRYVNLAKTGSEGKNGAAFILPVPARPGKSSRQWSEWFPRQQQDGQPWPSDKMSCRFRVEFAPAPPPPKTYADCEAEEAAKKEAEFLTIPADAVLSQWLPYVRYEQPQTERALQAIAKRPNVVREIEELALGEDIELGSLAIGCIEKLPGPKDPFNASMQRVGQDIAERIRRVNATPAGQDPSDLVASDIALRFTSWHSTISALREKSGGDFTPELKTILELSRVRKDSRAMQLGVCRVASYYLHEWAGVEPLPTDPKPR